MLQELLEKLNIMLGEEIDVSMNVEAYDKRIPGVTIKLKTESTNSSFKIYFEEERDVQGGNVEKTQTLYLEYDPWNDVLKDAILSDRTKRHTLASKEKYAMLIIDMMIIEKGFKATSVVKETAPNYQDKQSRSE